MKYSITFESFCKQQGLTEAQGLALINEAQDQVDFCAIVARKEKRELTVKEAAEIYETAPWPED